MDFFILWVFCTTFGRRYSLHPNLPEVLPIRRFSSCIPPSNLFPTNEGRKTKPSSKNQSQGAPFADLNLYKIRRKVLADALPLFQKMGMKPFLLTHLTQYFIFQIFFSFKSKSFFANKSIKIWVWAIAQATGRLPATSHFATLRKVSY